VNHDLAQRDTIIPAAVEKEKGDLCYADGMERICKGHQSERSTALVFLNLDKSSEQEIR
jgi:hypothetical protein